MALYINYKKPIKQIWGGGQGKQVKAPIEKAPKTDRKPPVVTLS